MTYIKKIPSWVWTAFVGFGTIVGTVWGIMQFWIGIQTMIQDSVKQSTINITTELVKTEHSIGLFLINDLRERIIGIEDEIYQLQRNDTQIPLHLSRKLRMMKERLNEGKKRWEK